MRVLAIAVSSAIGLWACADMQVQQRTKAFQLAQLDARADCRAKHPRPPSSLSDYMRCLNDGTQRAAIEHDYPHLDLVQLMNAYRMALAKRVDEGLMSSEDANLKAAELGSRISQEEQRRTAETVRMRAQAQQANAMSAAAMGALLQGIGVYNQSLQPPATITVTPQMPITCHRMGVFVTCQ